MKALKMDGDKLVSNCDPSYPPLTQVPNFMSNLTCTEKVLGIF